MTDRRKTTAEERLHNQFKYCLAEADRFRLMAKDMDRLTMGPTPDSCRFLDAVQELYEEIAEDFSALADLYSEPPEGVLYMINASRLSYLVEDSD